jgi:hypothetical protein
MQMRRWRRFGSLLVLAVCTLVASSAPGRPNGAAVGVPPGAKITKIGPQEVVIEHADGYISKYDDPSQQERECNSAAACAGKALAAFGVFGALVYEELTTNVEGGGAPAGPNGRQ